MGNVPSVPWFTGSVLEDDDIHIREGPEAALAPGGEFPAACEPIAPEMHLRLPAIDYESVGSDQRSGGQVGSERFRPRRGFERQQVRLGLNRRNIEMGVEKPRQG